MVTFPFDKAISWQFFLKTIKKKNLKQKIILTYLFKSVIYNFTKTIKFSFYF